MDVNRYSCLKIYIGTVTKLKIVKIIRSRQIRYFSVIEFKEVLDFYFFNLTLKVI